MAKLSPKDAVKRLQVMREVADSQGGKLLSETYLGTVTPHLWCCVKGHEWNARFSDIVKRLGWCPYCSGVKIPEGHIGRAKRIAEERGGLCLSTSAKSVSENLLWKCSFAHEWEATLSNTSRGKWCPWCSGNRVDKAQRLKQARRVAQNHGGECLSDAYESNKHPLSWCCSEGHEWSASFAVVVTRGAWCGKCRGGVSDPEKQISLAHEYARSRNGECLSKEYKKNAEKMLWRCERGHVWRAVFYSVVQSRSWCPICSLGLRERQVRQIFNQLTGSDFVSIRPNFLRNPDTGRNLELDGYCKELRLAFEYQGEQHQQIIKNFGMTNKRLHAQMRRDETKRKLCRDEGVRLIEVPSNIRLADLPRWTHKEILRVAPEIEKSLSDWRNVQVDEWLESERYSLEDLAQSAESRGGECISATYHGVKERHDWRCAKGHDWSATFDSVLSGSWCPVCSGNIVDASNRIDIIRRMVEAKGGTCLSERYEKNSVPIQVRCSEGHEWNTNFWRLQNGHWCKKCGSKRRWTNAQQGAAGDI